MSQGAILTSCTNPLEADTPALSELNALLLLLHVTRRKWSRALEAQLRTTSFFPSPLALGATRDMHA